MTRHMTLQASTCAADQVVGIVERLDGVRYLSREDVPAYRKTLIRVDVTDWLVNGPALARAVNGLAEPI